MQRLEIPAGSAIKLTATALSDGGVHRWDVLLFSAGDPAGNATPWLTLGSKIGGDDCSQVIAVPAQEADCWLEVTCRHRVSAGWEDDRCSLDDSVPRVSALGFSKQVRPKGQEDEVLLSFAFSPVAQGAGSPQRRPGADAAPSLRSPA